MNRKSAMIISSSLMVAILVAIVAFSLAWYTSASVGSQVVTADGISVSAHKVDGVSITTGDDVNAAYKGQTGLKPTEVGAVYKDYPYRAIKTFAITLEPKSLNMAVSAQLTKAEVRLATYDESTGDGLLSSTDDPTMLDNFAWTLYLATPHEGAMARTNYYPGWYWGLESNKWYDGDKNEITDTDFVQYFDSRCHDKTDNLLRTVDGDTLDLSPSLTDINKEQTLTFVLEITFLDVDSYCLFLQQEGMSHPTHTMTATEMKAFAYSDKRYMNSRFDLAFAVGMDVKHILPPVTGE